MKRTIPLAAARALAATSARAGAINLFLTQACVYAYPGDTVSFDASMFASVAGVADISGQ
jgi:hypothetical protein